MPWARCPKCLGKLFRHSARPLRYRCDGCNLFFKMTEVKDSELMIEEKKLVSSVEDLNTLVGRNIRCTREFSGVPMGTEGEIVAYRPRSDTLDIHEAVTIRWNRRPGDVLEDDFGRDRKFDETQWLELLPDHAHVWETLESGETLCFECSVPKGGD